MGFYMTDKDLLIRKIIETDNTIGSTYHQFLEYAIKKKDDSRFFLIDFPATLLQINKIKDNKIEDRYLSNLLEPTLYRINKLVIDNNDFELFKSEINDFSTFQVLESPIKIRDQINYQFYKLSESFILNGYNIRFDEEIAKKIEYFQLLVNFNLFRNFKLWKGIEDDLLDFETNLCNSIDEFKDKEKLNSLDIPNLQIDDSVTYDRILEDIKNSKKRIKSIISGPENGHDENIKELLYDFYVNSIIYKTFLIIGAYCIFTYRNKNINGINYIKELWYHTKPTIENRTIFFAKTPVEFHPFWLFNLFLFGGIDSDIWMDWAVRPGGFDDYYDTRPYIIQYFLLSLTNSASFDIFPTPEQLIRLKSENKTGEIDIWYDIINRLIFQKSEIVENFEKLINESYVWDPVLKKDIIIEGEKKTINAEERLMDAKNNIVRIIDNLSDVKTEIDKLVPLDNDKIGNAVNIIVESYYQTSEIPLLFNLKEYTDEEDFRQIELRPQVMKSCLIKSIFIDCRAIWQKIGRDIAAREYKSLNDNLSTYENIITKELENSNPIEIYDEIKTRTNILNENFNPNTILIPTEEYYQLEIESLKKESPLFEKLIYEEHKSFLLVDELELEMVSSSEFKQITVMDSNEISWIYKPDPETSERISVSIVESETNSAEADVTAKTIFKIEIGDYNAIIHIKWKERDENYVIFDHN